MKSLFFWIDAFAVLFRKNQAFKWYLFFLFLSLIFQWISPSLLVDSYEYLNASVNFQNSGTFSSCLHNVDCDHVLPETRRTPAYPFLIAAFGRFGLLMLQVTFSAFVPVIVYDLLQKWQVNPISDKQNRYFNLFILAYPLQFFYSSMLMPEQLCQFLVLLLVWYGYQFKFIQFSVSLSILLLLKPVFILLLPIPIILFFYKPKPYKWMLILPLLVFTALSYVNFKSFNVFHYSSVSVENKYEYNAAKLFINNISAADKLPNDSLLKRMSFEKRYHLLDSLGNKIIAKNVLTYATHHIKGSFLACIDPGRYDFLAYFKINSSGGFMNALREGGWWSMLKSQSIWMLLYLLIFTLVNIARMSMALISMKYFFKKYCLIYIFIFILIGVTGPVGSARYLFPIMPLISLFAILSVFNHEKNLSVK